MKLILKDGNEITITRANNMYSYDNLKDGLGCDLNKNAVSTIVIFNPDKPFDQIREMLSGDNRKGFKIVYGNTEKDYTGMRVATVIELEGNAVPETVEPEETNNTEKSENKEKVEETA